MKQWTKVALATLLLGSLVGGFGGCGEDGEVRIPVTEEVWKTVTDATRAMGKFEGAFSAKMTVKSESKDPEDEGNGTVTYEVSYDEESRLGYEIAIFPFEDGGAERSKIVKEGDEYYVYYVDNDENGAITAEKYSAENYAKLDPREDVFGVFEMLYEGDLIRWGSKWTTPCTYAEYKAAFADLFASDSTAKLSAYSKAESDGAITLVVEWSGTVADGEKTEKLSSRDEVTVKNGAVTKCVSKVEDGYVKQERVLTVSSSFNQSGYDKFSLAGAPDKGTIEEVIPSVEEEKKYGVNVVYAAGEYVVPVYVRLDSEGTVAEQVAEVKKGNSHYTVEGYYVDEAMTTALADDISKEDWLALNTVYAKATIAEENGALVSTSKPSQAQVTVPEGWEWFVAVYERNGWNDKSINNVVSIKEGNSAAYSLDSVMLANGAKAYVNGTLVTEKSITVEKGKGYYIEYRYDAKEAQSLADVYYDVLVW